MVPVRIGILTEGEPRPYSVHGLFVCGRPGSACAMEEPASEDSEREANGCCGCGGEEPVWTVFLWLEASLLLSVCCDFLWPFVE